jgi:glyoxylase-like metal-dependent hydrolase (beta-lactamase superfamily II)
MWLHPLTLGTARVTSLTDALFRLDGGAMFGVVPKVLWEKLIPSDPNNRISLRINPLLIQMQGKNILIETGMLEGDAKFQKINAVVRDQTIFDSLKALNLEPADIHMVINTHLHYDHAGRNTTQQGNQYRATFPHAQYFVQKTELEEASHTHERNRASYFPELWEPLLATGQLELLMGHTELLPGLSVTPAPGHNLGMQVVTLEQDGQTLVYTADLMPTLHHAPYAYLLGYDLYPVTCLEQRKKFLPQWFAQGAILAPPHDALHPFGRLEQNSRGGFVAKPY